MLSYDRVKLFTFCLIFLATASTGCSPFPPSDDILIETLVSNRSDFETLVEMMDEDTNHIALHKVAKDYILYNRGEEGTIDKQRFQEYRDLLDKLNLHSITHYSTRNEESFQIKAYVHGGMPEGGVYKGYTYFCGGFPERLKSSLVESLEYDPQTYEPGTFLYRKIDENWYLWLIY